LAIARRSAAHKWEAEMKFQHLALSDLSINRANDRHGELENETAAIAWLFNNKEQHMKNLARDLVEQEEMYEPPLVSAGPSGYIVFDGNRRVTCMKLLANPSRAPTADLQKYFADLKANWKGEFPHSVLCQIETDRDRLDDILYRRHTGSQNGVGQSTWDDRMKSNFVQRTGKQSGVNVAEQIEAKLAAAQMLPGRRKIPRSTLNRLLSAEGFRNRVGITVRNGQVQFTHQEPHVLTALQRITDDLAHRRVVLGDIWDVDDKRAYLDQLQAEGVLPPSSTALAQGQSSQKKPRSSSTRNAPSSSSKPLRRTTLIPDTPYSVIWSGRVHRQRAIWDELQFRLKLAEHPNAIAVLFRVLLELSVDNYLVQVSVQGVSQADKLAKKALRAAQDLEQKGKIDQKQLQLIQKFQNLDPLVSADTLNRYVHSAKFAPSPDHLTALWDSLSNFIVQCLSV
jgi:hypothetical protein